MKFNTNTLNSALKFSTPFASSFDGMYPRALDGIKFKTDGEYCDIVTTDGTVLHKARVALLEPCLATEFVVVPFKLDPDKSGTGETEIIIKDNTAIVTQTSVDGKRKSETVKLFDEQNKFVDYARIIAENDNDSECVIFVDPVKLAKTLKAFTKVGSTGMVELRFTPGTNGVGIHARMPIKIVNRQKVRNKSVADEVAIVLPMRSSSIPSAVDKQ